jgi:hypothetical protein
VQHQQRLVTVSTQVPIRLSDRPMTYLRKFGTASAANAPCFSGSVPSVAPVLRRANGAERESR